MTTYVGYPGRFVLALDQQPGASLAAREEFLRDWKLVLLLESRQHEHVVARSMRSALFWADWAVVRLCFSIVELELLNNVEPHASNRILRAMFEIVPDSKTDEDIHQHIRGKTRQHRNRVVKGGTLYGACLDAEVPQQRNMNAVSVTAAEVASAPRSIVLGRVQREALFKAGLGQLPSWCNEIMLPGREWSSPAVPAYWKAMTAWHWVQTFFTQDLGDRDILLRDAWRCKLLSPGTLVVTNMPDAKPKLVLAVGAWGALVSDLTPVCDRKWELTYAAGSFRWLHLTHVDLSCSSLRGYYLPGRGIVFSECDDNEDVLRFACRRGVWLTVVELNDILAALLESPPPRTSPRDVLLETLLSELFGSGEAYTEILARMQTLKADNDDDDGFDAADHELADLLEQICEHDDMNTSEIIHLRNELQSRLARTLRSAQQRLRRKKPAPRRRKAKPKAKPQKRPAAKGRPRMRPRRQALQPEELPAPALTHVLAPADAPAAAQGPADVLAPADVSASSSTDPPGLADAAVSALAPIETDGGAEQEPPSHADVRVPRPGAAVPHRRPGTVQARQYSTPHEIKQLMPAGVGCKISIDVPGVRWVGCVDGVHLPAVSFGLRSGICRRVALEIFLDRAWAISDQVRGENHYVASLPAELVEGFLSVENEQARKYPRTQ